jgi:formylmethanofuran dehydrogenase subunit E
VTEINDIPSLIDKAVKLHGHLGPFLVIGVRMGDLAKSHVLVDDKNSPRLRASIRTPLSTPFSCVIDGIQASTSCTVGNQRLKIEDSAKEITASFRLENANKAVRILVNPKVVENLIKDMSKRADEEQLALKIANMQAEQLFVLEEHSVHQKHSLQRR